MVDSAWSTDTIVRRVRITTYHQERSIRRRPDGSDFYHQQLPVTGILTTVIREQSLLKFGTAQQKSEILAAIARRAIPVVQLGWRTIRAQS